MDLLIKNGTVVTATEKFKADIAVADGKITDIAESIDPTDGTKVVDANDAQLVYNIYNAMYDNFETVSMRKFLEADVNGDKTVSTLDSAAIVNNILG